MHIVMATEDESEPKNVDALPVLQPLAYQPVRRESGALTAWSIFLLRFFTFAIQVCGVLCGVFLIFAIGERKPVGEIVIFGAVCFASLIAGYGLRRLADWIR